MAQEHDVFVITDEVYEHIVYEPFVHTYFASLPGMFSRTLSCSALSKTYSITGWRLGYVIAPPEVIAEARKVHDFLTVGAAAPLQEAAITALNFPDEYYADLRRSYTERRDVFLDAMEKAGLPYTIPQGAYYVMADIEEFGCADDTRFCEWMARAVGVAAVPGSSFFSEPTHRYIRFHFAKKLETLAEAGSRLRRLKGRLDRRRSDGIEVGPQPRPTPGGCRQLPEGRPGIQRAAEKADGFLEQPHLCADGCPGHRFSELERNERSPRTEEPQHALDVQLNVRGPALGGMSVRFQPGFHVGDVGVGESHPDGANGVVERRRRKSVRKPGNERRVQHNGQRETSRGDPRARPPRRGS